MSSLETKGIPPRISVLTWQCEYEKIELPCKLCSERKLSCTVADKVWGETRRLKEATVAEQDRGRLEPLHDEIAVEIIPRQISVPSDQKLAPVEGAYLQHFFLGTDQPHKRFTTLSKCGFTLAQILRTRFAFQLGQGQLPKAIQYSLILLSTYDIWDFQPFITSNSRSANDPWLSNWVREIKSRFYECMIYAISKQDHLEIAYGCMGMCFYLFVANGEAVEFIKHIKGFLTTLVAFSQTAPLSHEIYTLYFMYLSLLYQLQLGFAHHEDAFNELLEFIIYV